LVAGIDKARRQQIFDEVAKRHTPESMVGVQLEIAEVILQAERNIGVSTDLPALQFHIGRLQLFADALAWWTLHPHVIRQLCKAPETPRHTLKDQGDAFATVLHNASALVKYFGTPVLISDLTNILRVGDLLVVTDPESPMIVEVKTKLPSASYLSKGRIGRQISRSMDIVNYLKDGRGRIYGQEAYNYVIETSTKAERNWGIVENLCLEAGNTGAPAFNQVLPGEWLWVVPRGNLQVVLETVADIATSSGPVFFGTTGALMAMKDGLFPPPSAWPISQEARFALCEEELILAHLLEVKSLNSTSADGKMTINVDMGTSSGVKVTIDGEEYALSNRFVYDVVFGLESVESAIRGIFAFAQAIKERFGDQIHGRAEGPLVVPRTGRPRTIHEVGNQAQASAVLALADTADGDLVAVTDEFAREIITSSPKHLFLPGEREEHGGKQLRIMPVKAFKRFYLLA